MRRLRVSLPFLLPSPASRLAVRARGGLWILAWVLAACGEEDRPGEPALENAPDSFTVSFETSAGPFLVTLHRDWSPAGVDRIHRLARENFYAGARIYRVNPRYAQFGYTGRPGTDSLWVSAGLPDEPARASNVRGAVSFARGGPDSRSVLLFVNRGDNSDLDTIPWRGVAGFPPVGRVVEGMDVVDRLYDGYGDDPMQWEDSIASRGNEFLDRRFPLLDSITGVRIVDEWR